MTRRPRRPSEQAASFARGNNLHPREEPDPSEEHVAQSEPGVFALDSMTDLLGSESIASVGLEEFFDVFIFWTPEVSSPYEDSPSKLVPDALKTSESIIVSVYIDGGPDSAQDKRADTSSDHILTPHTQTDIAPNATCHPFFAL